MLMAGVRQGEPLYPILFGLLVNDLPNNMLEQRLDILHLPAQRSLQ